MPPVVNRAASTLHDTPLDDDSASRDRLAILSTFTPAGLDLLAPLDKPRFNDGISSCSTICRVAIWRRSAGCPSEPATPTRTNTRLSDRHGTSARNVQIVV